MINPWAIGRCNHSSTCRGVVENTEEVVICFLHITSNKLRVKYKKCGNGEFLPIVYKSKVFVPAT